MKIIITGRKADGKTRLMNEAIIPWFASQKRNLTVRDGVNEIEAKKIKDKDNTDIAVIMEGL